MKRLFAIALLSLHLVSAPEEVRAGDVLVFAAASLREALEEAAESWQAETGKNVRLSLAGSSTLARQIQAGAPADLFLSANEAWMDALEAQGFLRPGSRRDLLTNELVLIAWDRHMPPVDFSKKDGLAEQVGDDRLAMALVDAVPAGIYGKTALQSLGWWEGVAARVVQADNVRAALALVAMGEAPLGVVYATDAMAEPRVHIVGTFPPESHPPIRYPMAIPAESTSDDAAAFAEFLAGPAAGDIFRAHGFGLARQEGQ